MSKKAKPYQLEMGNYTNVKPELVPLKCINCGIPLPLSDDDNIKCPACSHINVLPNEYRVLRDSKKQIFISQQSADELIRKLSQRPNFLMMAWYKTAETMTSVFGLIMAILLWISGLSFLVFLFIVYILYYTIAPYIGINLIDVYGPGNVYALTFFAINVVFILPLVLNAYIKDYVDLRKTLQASLSVRYPEHDSAVASCRACGAPIETKPGQISVRCFYCNTVNMAHLPKKWLSSIKDFAKWKFKTVEEYEQTEKKFRITNRKRIYNWAIASLIFIGIFWCIGAFIRWVDNDPVSVPSWSKLNAVPKQMYVKKDPAQSIPILAATKASQLATEYWIALENQEICTLSVYDFPNDVDVYFFNTTTFDEHRFFEKVEWTRAADGAWVVSWKAPYKGIFGIATHTYGKVEKPFTIKWQTSYY